MNHLKFNVFGKFCSIIDLQTLSWLIPYNFQIGTSNLFTGYQEAITFNNNITLAFWIWLRCSWKNLWEFNEVTHLLVMLAPSLVYYSFFFFFRSRILFWFLSWKDLLVSGYLFLWKSRNHIYSGKFLLQIFVMIFCIL